MISKSELIQKISDETALAKKDVKAVLEKLMEVGHKELKKIGEFQLPGFAKFTVVKKPAVPERQALIVPSVVTKTNLADPEILPIDTGDSPERLLAGPETGNSTG